MAFYIFYRHRACIVNCVDLICSLYSWWDGFGSSSLATLPLGFNNSFISPLRVCCPLGFASEDALEDLGLSPVRVRCGGGAAAWVAGVLAAPSTQGSWRLG